MDLLEKADVLEYYDATISSTREEYYLPAVMKARWYNGKKPIRVALSRRNILLRDKLCCQYCGKSGKHGAVSLTLDHVIPQSKGGGNTWDNLVTACAPCNTKKGDKTLRQLKWKLKKEPQEPSAWELDLVLASVGAGDLKSIPEEWAGYLFYEKSSTITGHVPQGEGGGNRSFAVGGSELTNNN
jgi:5-methylcytosine-specific restriction endonuclease McrA